MLLSSKLIFTQFYNDNTVCSILNIGCGNESFDPLARGMSGMDKGPIPSLVMLSSSKLIFIYIF